MSSFKEVDNKLNSHLILDSFKIKPCKLKNFHIKNKCNYHHNLNDKRRNLNISKYCFHLNFNKDKKDENYAMNKIEVLYHNNFYKKKFCKNYFQGKKCELDKYCSFIHDLKELKSIQIFKLNYNFNFFIFFFKTEFCPFGLISHDKKICAYAHNFQDYKRKNLSKLIPQKCKNWENEKCYYDYNWGCINGFNCNYCHGWKEFLYHPLNFKTKKCLNSKKNCKNLVLCTYYHSNKEKRVVDKNDFFEFVPSKSFKFI